ncbi:hypothetical protein NQZ79_g7035 [Umbelopsis isabellina]|nr:hypothetical protein NQZ79_g7035 [Umbelopsis isabellina]
MNNQGDGQESNGGVENLRQFVKQLPSKQKARKPLQHEDFVYGETDDNDIEINEFFNYNEVPGFHEYQSLFDERKPEEWSSMNHLRKRNYVFHLLNDLEHSVQQVRLDAGKQLLYIAQGEFGDAEVLHCTGDDRVNHLRKIKENNSLLQECGALAIIYTVLRKACEEHDRQSHLSNLQDTNEEIGISLTIMYMLLETLRGEASLFSDLECLDPPLLVFLFGLMSQLREKNLKMFPVKKLLLVVWKAILASFGGQDDVDRIRNTIRKAFQLPAVKLNESQTRSTPQDLHTFTQEVVQKYPTYTGPSYPEHVEKPELIKPTAALTAMLGSNGNIQGNVSDVPKGHLGTGKIINLGQQSKRQSSTLLSQNVQKEPFILPFSSWDMSVPKSIQEAGEMYSRHMYVSLATLQILKERERVLRKSVISNDADGFEFILRFKDEMADLESEHEDPALTAEKKEAARRLDMVEALYTIFESTFIVDSLFQKSIVPNLQNIIIVLLKLLLATVTANNGTSTSTNNPNNEKVPDRGALSADGAEPTHKTDADEVDAKRNKEITSKAVSAILVLLLRWTKLSHVLKYENVSQLLVDSGCLLLILKILGLQDMAVTLSEQPDNQEKNFFNYWSIQRRKQINENNVHEPIPDMPAMKYRHTNWRNMFWCINFLRIMQKLTKRKTHRIMLLVQYKSSVSYSQKIFESIASNVGALHPQSAEKSGALFGAEMEIKQV